MIGLVFKNDSKDKQYTMEVYTTDGKLKFKENFNIPYTTIKLSGGNILMYNSSPDVCNEQQGSTEISWQCGWNDQRFLQNRNEQISSGIGQRCRDNKT